MEELVSASMKCNLNIKQEATSTYIQRLINQEAWQGESEWLQSICRLPRIFHKDVLDFLLNSKMEVTHDDYHSLHKSTQYMTFLPPNKMGH